MLVYPHTGFGSGLAYLPSNVIIGFYFEKYLKIAYGLAALGAGVFMVGFSPLLQYWIDHFGWRGAMLLCAAVCLHMFVCGALMRSPVEMTMQRVGKLSEKDGKRRKAYFDYTLMMNPSFVFFTISQLLVWAALSVAFGHLPAMARFSGYSAAQAASLMSFYGAANILWRPLTGLLISVPGVDTLVAFCIMCGLAALFALLIAFVRDSFIGLVVCTFFMSSFGNAVMVIMAPLTIQLVGLGALGDGLSIGMLAMGLGCLVGPPIAGRISINPLMNLPR